MSRPEFIDPVELPPGTLLDLLAVLGCDEFDERKQSTQGLRSRATVMATNVIRRGRAAAKAALADAAAA